MTDTSDSRPVVTWDDMSGMMDSGLFSQLDPEAAASAISDVVHRPVADGKPVDPAEFDGYAMGSALVERYVQDTFPRILEEAGAAADSVRADMDADVAPALCRASGVPSDAYSAARAQRDAGDPSLMLDMYAAFLASL